MNEPQKTYASNAMVQEATLASNTARNTPYSLQNHEEKTSGDEALDGLGTSSPEAIEMVCGLGPIGACPSQRPIVISETSPSLSASDPCCRSCREDWRSLNRKSQVSQVLPYLRDSNRNDANSVLTDGFSSYCPVASTGSPGTLKRDLELPGYKGAVKE